MTKKTWVGVLIGCLVIAGSLVGGFFLLRTEAPVSHDVLAAAKEAAPACLVDNTALSIGDADQSGIETVVLGRLTHVPAGTNVDIYYATYDGKTANGSAIYPGTYGTYNFTVKKASPANDWQLTAFDACKKY
ncbi:MAG TPA: hypothetical protein VLI54_01055 [Bacillota bacterium]|nr:hypothetical protein [Bacillota bacterium]